MRTVSWNKELRRRCFGSSLPSMHFNKLDRSEFFPEHGLTRFDPAIYCHILGNKNPRLLGNHFSSITTVLFCHPEGEGTETCFGLRLKDLPVASFFGRRAKQVSGCGDVLKPHKRSWNLELTELPNSEQRQCADGITDLNCGLN